MKKFTYLILIFILLVGLGCLIFKKDTGFDPIIETNQEKMATDIISLCTGRLKKYGDYDFFENISFL